MSDTESSDSDEGMNMDISQHQEDSGRRKVKRSRRKTKKRDQWRKTERRQQKGRERWRQSRQQRKNSAGRSEQGQRVESGIKTTTAKMSGKSIASN